MKMLNFIRIIYIPCRYGLEETKTSRHYKINVGWAVK